MQLIALRDLPITSLWDIGLAHTRQFFVSMLLQAATILPDLVKPAPDWRAPPAKKKKNYSLFPLHILPPSLYRVTTLRRTIYTVVFVRKTRLRIFFVGYFTTLSVIQTIMCQMEVWFMNDELERIWKKGAQSRKSMVQMIYEPGSFQIETQSNVTNVTMHVTRLWLVFACYKELSWSHLEQTKKFPLIQCSPSNAATMPTSVTISIHTSTGEYMLLVSSNTVLSNIYICNTTIKLFESSISSTHYLTHNLPQPLVSGVLGQE